ncbi:Alkylated DNA repair protein [Neofusicoccum parvum]|nr:Alkylated DNA repair protein [Neofusicoccum parvum]
MMSLDAHERPPDRIRNAYKKYQKLRGRALDSDPDLLDLRAVAADTVDQLHVVRSISPTDLRPIFEAFVAGSSSDSLALPDAPVPVYEHRHMPEISRIQLT